MVHKGKGKRYMSRERFSIKTKLIASHGAIGLLPMILVMLLVLSTAKSGIMDEVKKAQLDTSIKTAMNLNMLFQSADISAGYIRRDVDLVTVLEKDMDDYANSYQFQMERRDVIDPVYRALKNSNTYVGNLTFVKDHEVISFTDNPYMKSQEFLNDFKESEEYEIIMGAEANAVHWYYDAYESDYIYAIRRIDYAISGKKIQMITGYDQGYFTSALQIDKLEEGVGTYIIDSRGRVIVSNMPQEDGKMWEEFSRISRFNLAGEGQIEPFILSMKNRESEEVMIGAAPLDNGWYYIRVTPTRLVLGAIGELMNIAITSTLIGGLLALGAGVVTAFNIIKPIHYIKGLMQKLEQGDFTTVSCIEGRFDMGQLSHSFNQMVKNIGTLLKESRYTSAKLQKMLTICN